MWCGLFLGLLALGVLAASLVRGIGHPGPCGGYALISHSWSRESHVPHIHTRWLGHDGPPIDSLVDPLGLLANAYRTEWEWGRLWTVPLKGVVAAPEQSWTSTSPEVSRLLAIYQLEKAVTRSGLGVVGVASPLPADTSAILTQLQDLPQPVGARFVSLRTNLSPESLFNLSNCVIESVRTVVPHGYNIDQFATPIDVEQLQTLHAFDQITGVTALLYHGDAQVVVNLFEDNQFYVADSSPQVIGEIARRVGSLWEESSDARVLQKPSVHTTRLCVCHQPSRFDCLARDDVG
jgi:hypothetical protein